ncbi:hypothetical protein BJX99DRAFT_272054 [Aspergillus californicus]
MDPFLRLPTELIQQITYFLPKDKDIINLALCSTNLASRILPIESHIWSRLFRYKYDDCSRRSPVENQIEYQVRALVLSRPISFGHGEREEQRFWLTLLRDMIVDMLLPTTKCSKSQDGEGKNLARLREALFKSEFLNRPVSGFLMRRPKPPSDLFCAVQLFLTYLALDPSMSVHCLRTDYNIGAVYECPDIDKPLFYDDFSVSMETALDIRNFWLRHLLNPDECTFYSSYMTCICPLPLTIRDLELHQTCAELNGHMVEVEHATISLTEHPDLGNWPELFQELVSPFSGLGQNPILFRGTLTYHGSVENRSIPIRGFVEGVNGDDGICGRWFRICFVAYERPRYLLPGYAGAFFDEPWPPTDMSVDFTSVYGYEGLVVPGGSLVVGQWWDVLTKLTAGPFIFWGV